MLLTCRVFEYGSSPGVGVGVCLFMVLAGLWSCEFVSVAGQMLAVVAVGSEREEGHRARGKPDTLLKVC